MAHFLHVFFVWILKAQLLGDGCTDGEGAWFGHLKTAHYSFKRT